MAPKKQARIEADNDIEALVRGVAMKDVTPLPPKLTPFEQQVAHLRRGTRDAVVLMVAVGYKMQFLGRDARLAKRRLGLMCVPSTPFEHASVPVQRTMHYASRLVGMGYMVGLVEQSETAAVRATEGKAAATFSRRLTRVLSRGTTTPESFEGSVQAPNEDDDDDGCQLESTPPAIDTRESHPSRNMLFLGVCGDIVEGLVVSLVTARREALDIRDESHLRPSAEDLHIAFDLVERPLDLSYACQLLARCRNVHNVRLDAASFTIFLESCLRVHREDVATYALENAEELGFLRVDHNCRAYVEGTQSWYKHDDATGRYYPLTENEALNAASPPPEGSVESLEDELRRVTEELEGLKQR